MIPDSWKPVGKAITGSLVAGFTSAGVALTDGHISAAEWTVIAVAFLGGFGAVWSIPNASPTASRAGTRVGVVEPKEN